jgi:hypothetical protein
LFRHKAGLAAMVTAILLASSVVGQSSEEKIDLQGNEAVRPIFRASLEPFKDLGASTLSIANIGATDHVSLDEIGLPGFEFIPDYMEGKPLPSN